MIHRANSIHKLLCFPLLLLASGCARWNAPTTEYTTVVTDSGRDESKAIELTEKAAEFLAKGKVGQAEQTLQTALSADVSYGPAHNNLGTLYYEQGKLYLAAWEFEYARKLMPDQAEPSNNLGMVYEEADRLEQAISYYSIAYEMSPHNPEYIGNLARARMKEDLYDKTTRFLVTELIMYDTRPEWTDWAHEQLAIAKWTDTPASPVEPEAAPVVDIHQTPAIQAPTQEERIETPQGQPSPFEVNYDMF